MIVYIFNIVPKLIKVRKSVCDGLNILKQRHKHIFKIYNKVRHTQKTNFCTNIMQGEKTHQFDESRNIFNTDSKQVWKIRLI